MNNFSLGIKATNNTQLKGVNRNTVNQYLILIREIISKKALNSDAVFWPYLCR